MSMNDAVNQRTRAASGLKHTAPSALPAPGSSFYWVTTPWGPVLRCRSLDPLVEHFFSARGLDPGKDASPVDRIAAWMGVRPADVRRLRQVHGNAVHMALPAPHEGDPPEGDALVTNVPGLVLAVRTADCVPVLLAAPNGRAVAAIHAGWRGLAARVLQAAVERLRAAFAVTPASIVAALGPSMGPEHYEVGPDVLEVFRQAGHAEERSVRWFCKSTASASTPDATPARYLLDLWQASRDALEEAGLAEDRIYAAELSTASAVDVFHSYRVEGERAGRMYSAIACT
jgi:polyphenol oxidase